MARTCKTHRKSENVSRYFIGKMKSRTHSQIQGRNGRITLNYLSNKQNVDVTKYSVAITALVITIVKLRIS